MKEEQFIKIRTAVNSSLKGVLLNKSKDILNEENIKTMFYYFKGYPKTSYIDLYNLIDEKIADCIYENNLIDYAEMIVTQLYYSNKLSKIIK